MAKQKFIRTKPHCNVGTIGHVDHGKTTLTAAMTKVSADNGWGVFVSYAQVAKASAAQGTRDDSKILPIATSHVEYATAERHYSHVDCPGHDPTVNIKFHQGARGRFTSSSSGTISKSLIRISTRRCQRPASGTRRSSMRQVTPPS